MQLTHRDATQNQTGTALDAHYGYATIPYCCKIGGWVLPGGRIISRPELKQYAEEIHEVIAANVKSK